MTAPISAMLERATCNGNLQVAEAVAFLEEAARYFESRPTNGEDSAHWSNVYNSENCRKIAATLRALRDGAA